MIKSILIALPITFAALALPQYCHAQRTTTVAANENSLIKVDSLTGAGKPLSGAGLAGFRYTGLAFDPVTNTLYGTTVGQQLVTVDVSSGSSSVVGETGLNRITGLTFDRSRNVIYTMDFATNQLLQINPATGRTQAIIELDFDFPRGLAFDPISSTLYLTGLDFAAGLSELYAIDTNSCEFTTQLIGLSDVFLFDIAFDPDTSTLYGNSGETLVTIDKVTAQTTLIGTDRLISLLAFNPNSGTLYNGRFTELFTVDTSTGTTTFIGDAGHSIPGLAYDPATETLYGARDLGVESDIDLLVTIDALTGDVTDIGSIGFGSVRGLAYNTKRQKLYGTENGWQLISIDTQTGLGTAVGGPGSLGFSRVDGLAYDSVNDILYGVDSATNQLITINMDTGVGTALATVDTSNINSLAFDSASETLYGNRWAFGDVVTINTSTGQTTIIGPHYSRQLQGLSFHSGLGMLVGTGPKLERIDPSNGRTTYVGTLFGVPQGLEFNPTSQLLYTVTTSPTGSSSFLGVVNASLGDHTIIGDTDFLFDSLAYNINQDIMYGTTIFSRELVIVDLATAIVTPVAPLSGDCVQPSGLAFDPGTSILYGTQSFPPILCNIDTATGVTTQVMSTSTRVEGLMYDSNLGSLVGLTIDGDLIKLDIATKTVQVIGPTGFGFVRGGLTSFPDCNNNNIPDATDILEGASQDTNLDGVPDECSEWIGLAGNTLWNSPANWDTGVVPDNTVEDQFAVSIEGENTLVELNIDAKLNSLQMLQGATLIATSNKLTIETSAGLMNGGCITLDNGIGLSSVGAILFRNISNASRTVAGGCLPPSLTVSGVDLVSALSMDVRDNSTIQLADTASINLAENFRLSSGSYEADPDRGSPTSASLSSNDVLITNEVSGHGTMTLVENMTVTTSGNFVLKRSSSCGGSGVIAGGCLPPSLRLFDNAILNVGGALIIGEGVEFIVGTSSNGTAGGTTISCGCSVGNQAITGGKVDFRGMNFLLSGVGATFELSSTDIGNALSRLDANGALHSLEITSGADIHFIDSFDNALVTSGDEVLYVQTLILRAGSTVTVETGTIYYQDLNDEGALINGPLVPFIVIPVTNDVNLDQRVDLQDYLSFYNCMINSYPPDHPPLDPACIEFHDIDANNDVDLVDWAWFLESFTGP